MVVETEACTDSSSVAEGSPRGAPPIEGVQLGVGERQVLPPIELFPVRGRLFHVGDKWTFSPWLHITVSKGLGCS